MHGREHRSTGIPPLAVFVVVVALSALLSGYLTFKIQFEKHKEPSAEKPRELSYQTLRVKEQERKQVHDHFHLLTEDINLEAWADRSTCIACHSPYPHGRNKQAMAVMNLHTEFMTCHSCHLKIQPGESIRYGWVSPAGRASKAEPYGSQIDPKTGLLAETENHFSKLAPLRMKGGAWLPITSEAGIETALRYVQEREVIAPERRKEIEDMLHQGTELKEFVRCSQCHSENGIMDFRRLGFGPARINQLQKMEIGGMLTDYDTFYFPEFFEEKFR